MTLPLSSCSFIDLRKDIKSVSHAVPHTAGSAPHAPSPACLTEASGGESGSLPVPPRLRRAPARFGLERGAERPAAPGALAPPLCGRIRLSTTTSRRGPPLCAATSAIPDPDPRRGPDPAPQLDVLNRRRQQRVDGDDRHR